MIDVYPTQYDEIAILEFVTLSFIVKESWDSSKIKELYQSKITCALSCSSNERE